MKYTVATIQKLDDFLALKNIWNDLLTRSPTNTYFMRWEWLSTWWHIYSQADYQLNVIIIKNHKTIVCIAPLYTRKRYVAKFYPSKMLMFLGTQYHGKGDVCSDFMDLIYLRGQGHEQLFSDIIFQQINNKNVCDEIYLSKIDTSSATMRSLITNADSNGFLKIIREEYVSPYIELPGTWDAYMDSISTSMRYKIRREQRKLENNYNVSFRTSETTNELGSDYSELIRMHTDWWKKRNITGAFSDPLFRRFHQKILPVMLKNGHLDLHIMYEKNTNLAIQYLIKYDKKVYFYQSGIESNDKKSAFGCIMHSYCIDDAIKTGFTEYDFLPDINVNSYKQKYTKRFRNVSDIYLCRNDILKVAMTLENSTRIIYRFIKKTLGIGPTD